MNAWTWFRNVMVGLPLPMELEQRVTRQELEEQRRIQNVWQRLEQVGQEIKSIASREGSRESK